jgi:membrane protein implicated in regulation of membrane protease activity
MMAMADLFGFTALSIAGPDMGFWQGFYFACFVAGLLLSVVSLIGGMGHLHWHIHLPHGVHVPHVGHVPHGPAGAHAGQGGSGSNSLPWWNAFSIMVFLCWFGAAGYLIPRYGSLLASVVFVLAALCGLTGGALVFWFLARVMMPHDRALTAEETAVEGAVGTVSAAIRPGGVGEMLYLQMGARRSVPAKADSGEPIAHGEEVFVVRYEQGIAYVRRWEDLPDTEEPASGILSSQTR